MANTTLSAVILSGTSGSLSMIVTREDYKKTSDLFIMTMPASDDDSTISYDFEGVRGVLKVDGEVMSTSASALKTWCESLEALINGEQTTIEYVSDTRGTKNVKIEDVNTTWTKITDQSITFNVSLIVCAED